MTNVFDSFTISETQADKTVSDVDLKISIYQLFRQHCGPHNTGRGGLCIYVLTALLIAKMTYCMPWMTRKFLLLHYWICQRQCRTQPSFAEIAEYRHFSIQPEMFESFLSERYQRVRIEDTISDLVALCYDVPQGFLLNHCCSKYM